MSTESQESTTLTDLIAKLNKDKATVGSYKSANGAATAIIAFADKVGNDYGDAIMAASESLTSLTGEVAKMVIDFFRIGIVASDGLPDVSGSTRVSKRGMALVVNAITGIEDPEDEVRTTFRNRLNSRVQSMIDRAIVDCACKRLGFSMTQVPGAERDRILTLTADEVNGADATVKKIVAEYRVLLRVTVGTPQPKNQHTSVFDKPVKPTGANASGPSGVGQSASNDEAARLLAVVNDFATACGAKTTKLNVAYGAILAALRLIEVRLNDKSPGYGASRAECALDANAASWILFGHGARMSDAELDADSATAYANALVTGADADAEPSDAEVTA